MEKDTKQRWQFSLIVVVLLLTLYNILPTILYYSKPLNQPIDAQRAEVIIDTAMQRAQQTSEYLFQWVHSFVKGLPIKAPFIEIDAEDATTIHLSFNSEDDADMFAQWVEPAGAASISLISQQPTVIQVDKKRVDIGLRVGALPTKDNKSKLINFYTKYNEAGQPSQQYLSYIKDRFVHLSLLLTSENFLEDEGRNIVHTLTDQHEKDSTKFTSKHSLDEYIEAIYGYILPSQTHIQNTKILGQRALLASLYTIQKVLLEEQQFKKSEVSSAQFFLDIDTIAKKMYAKIQERKLQIESDLAQFTDDQAASAVAIGYKNLLHKLQTVLAALRHVEAIQKNDTERKHWSKDELSFWFDTQLQKQRDEKHTKPYVIAVPLSSYHPLFQSIQLNIETDKIELLPQAEVASLISYCQDSVKNFSIAEKQSKTSPEQKIVQFLENAYILEAAKLSKMSNEQVQARSICSYDIDVHSVEDAKSFIELSISQLAALESQKLIEYIEAIWKPSSQDLQKEIYPLYTIDQFQKAPQDAQRICILSFSPAQDTSSISTYLRPTSLYLILRGAKRFLDYAPSEQIKSSITEDFKKLSQMLQTKGFYSYSGEDLTQLHKTAEFSSDIIFELEHFYKPYVLATREAFKLYGHTPFALLECTNVEGRIRVENNIDDLQQDELVRWKELWQSAQVSLDPKDRIYIPQPTKNIFWSNLVRSWKKYFRGDSNRILKWGLDLSGGRSVKIGLYDSAMRPVVDEKDLKQAVSELYTRLNRMGVSERTIRIENNTISIDFPGIQGISSNELVQASAMYFHVVNEKFSVMNHDLQKDVYAFLQEVWNEAQLTDQKDVHSINLIAFKKLQAVEEGTSFSSSAKVLFNNGLRLHDPFDENVDSPCTNFDDTVSTIVTYRDSDESTSQGYSKKNHPLLIVFRNYALEGANLENVAPSYDSSKGNVLIFNVRSKDVRPHILLNPQEEFYKWTSHFSEESIQGTTREKYSRGRGWRMAVILNGTVVSDPALSASLKESAVISGSFSQREVQRLAKDLEAGSLSYTPKVLSECNVSPELGNMERIRGIAAACMGLVAVIAIMITYYRFAGVVACVAVFVNLLIIWAVMQNIEAAMTLPALAGIVLTVGMAVDANVLVFERIREELHRGAKLVYALRAGYSKAFSAIIDSNLTTIIAALILIQFDSGPIRGFAITLIIGIISSMFTSLFLTKYYFTQWIKKHPKKISLSMADWFPTEPKFDFLKYKKLAVILSCAVLACGICFTYVQLRSIFGMDFTGGYALIIETDTVGQNNTERDQVRSPKEIALHALQNAGLHLGEYQIRELGTPSLLRIQLSASLEEEGRPFSNFTSNSIAVHENTNPRIDWIVATLEGAGLVISKQQKSLLSTQWTAMSGQFSDAMKSNALCALTLSLIAILVYIAVRFEWKYAISAVIALIHDVGLTVSTMAILNACGVNVQINLEVVGAIMTIIGYSLNDTIIIFDRIREDSVLFRKKNFQTIVNMALNSTLSRTIMTSSTTLAVLLCLVVFGGASIFTFSLVMFIGILLGTISSLFIAAPLLVYFDKQEEKQV